MPNFNNPFLNFLAWVVIVVVFLIVAAWIISLLRDVLDDDAVATIKTLVHAAVTPMDVNRR